MQQQEYQLLVQKLANATVTYRRCNGHLKAERNQFLIEQYRQELIKYGFKIPSREELDAIAEYNGIGSW